MLPASLARAAEKEAEREKHVVQNEGDDSSLEERNREREFHENSDKLRLVSVSDSPDPFSPAVAGSLAVTGGFEARPTDAGAGNAKNGKTFGIRVTVTVSREGAAVRAITKEYPVTFPADLPASRYHPVTCALAWDGKDENAAVVADGEYTYSVQGTLVRYDGLGNGKAQEHVVATSTSLSGTVVVDSTPPVLSDFSPPDETYTKDPRIPVSGRAVDAGSGVASVTLTVEGDPVGTHDPATGVISWTPDADLPEKWIDVTLEATDLAGNEASAEWKFCEDRTAPVGTPVRPAPDSWTGDPRPDVVAALADELAGLDAGSALLNVNEKDVDATFDEATKQVPGTPGTDLPEGEITAIAKMKDLAGNLGRVSWAFNVDLTPPVASEPSPADQAWTNNTMPEISASLVDPLSGVDPTSIVMVVNDSEVEEPGFVQGRATYTPGIALPEGNVEVSVTASDEVGNAMLEPFEWKFGVDTSPATVSMTSPSAYTKEVRPLVTVNVSDALSGVNEDSFVMKLDGTTIGTGPGGTSSSPGWDLDEGEHTVSVEVWDNAGNPLPEPKTFTFAVDLTPPDIELLSPPSPTTQRKPKIEVCLTDQLSGVDDASLYVTLENAPITMTPVDPTTGAAWHVPETNLAYDLHTVVAVARDEVGNERSKEFTFVVEPLIPETGPITVGSGEEPLFNSLNEAIQALEDFLNGAEFDKPWEIVATGTFYETVVVPGTLHPTPENRLIIRSGSPYVLDGGGTQEYGYYVEADNVTIEDTEVLNFTVAGVYVASGDGGVFENLHVHDCGVGGDGVGIDALSGSTTITSCTTSNNGGYGIAVGNGNVWDCLVEGNGAGLMVAGDCEVKGNVVGNNGSYDLRCRKSGGSAEIRNNVFYFDCNRFP
jgi:hypothetical protein